MQIGKDQYKGASRRHGNKILPTNTTEYFSSIILGSLHANVDLMHVTVDQSLHVYYDTTDYFLLPYNDWGVMSTPNSVVVLNDNIVVLSGNAK